MEDKHFAWCDCCDALVTQEVYDDKEMIVSHTYYCLGCDKTYRLQEIKKVVS